MLHKIYKFLSISVVGLALATPLVGHALRLGPLKTHSALNQTLKAEIPLMALRGTPLTDIRVKVASHEAFERLGIDYPYELNSLQFNVKRVRGVPTIVVTSKERIKLHSLQFLLEVTWPKGHFYRTYTVLLDPPHYRVHNTPKANAVKTAAKVTSSTAKKVTTAATTTTATVAAQKIAKAATNTAPAKKDSFAADDDLAFYQEVDALLDDLENDAVPTATQKTPTTKTTKTVASTKPATTTTKPLAKVNNKVVAATAIKPIAMPAAKKPTTTSGSGILKKTKRTYGPVAEKATL